MRASVVVLISSLALMAVTCTAPDFAFRPDTTSTGGAASSSSQDNASSAGGFGGATASASTATVTSVGSTSNGGSTSTSTSSSSSSSAGSGGSSMIPPLAQHCFITTCNSGEVCCIDASNPNSHSCQDPANCDPVTKVPAHCTSSADCVDPKATHCCGNVIASTLISTVCQIDACNEATQVRMCDYFAGSNPECKAMEVCTELFTLTSAYGYCH